MQVIPYLYFDGNCAEALEFYKTALDAKVQMLMHFKDRPPGPDCEGLPPDSDDKVMHACFNIGDSVLMASDGNCKGEAKFEGVTLSLSLKTVEEADRIFHALLEGGKVQMPLIETFFSPRFGMVADRFGVSWMVVVEGKKP